MRAPAILLLLVAVATGDHAVVELECPPEVRYRVHRDLDGDGLEELLLLTEREAWLWRGRRDRWPAAPDARMKLPEGAALFDVGPDGAPRQQLVVRTAAAYWEMVPGQEPRRLPFVAGRGLPARPANVLWRGFFRDFDRDGQGDFLDVALPGYSIQFGGGGSVTLPPVLTEEADAAGDAVSDRFVARFALGDWIEGEFNGDGRPDFAIMTPRGLLVYPGDERGRFAPERRLEIEIEEAKDADLEFIDLNGDGKTDVLAARRFAGKTAVLVADPERGLLAPFRIQLAIPGEIRTVVAEDLDGDGRPDLALPFIGRPSIQMAIRALVRGEVTLRVPIFLNRGGRSCLGVRADTQISFPVRIRVGTDSAGRITLGGLVVVEYGGDLDGDGRKDLLVTSKPTLLAVYPGVAGRVFAEEAQSSITIPDCSDFDSVVSAAANLNGDESSDIILLYRGATRRPDRLYLLLSRKK